jgi:hypothetical protein
VEAEKNAGRTLRVANDETREELAIRSAVTHATGLDRIFVKTRRLKEDSFLGLPENSQQAEQQSECNEGGDHLRRLRGFQ